MLAGLRTLIHTQHAVRTARPEQAADDLNGPTAWGRSLGEGVFLAAGLSRPNPRIASDSIILRARLIAGSPYLGMFASSVLRRLIADNYASRRYQLICAQMRFPSGSSHSRTGLSGRWSSASLRVSAR